MVDMAWAIVIQKENYPAILSEAGRTFDRDFLERWVDAYGDGYFLRDVSSSLDCALITSKEFLLLYKFLDADNVGIFRKVEKIE